MKQSTNKILMIKPSNFYFNEQTAEDNLYQNKTSLNKDTIQNRALHEFEQFTNILKNEGIHINIFEDNGVPLTPDSIFPNNWFSTHDGTLVLYPMYAKNRRQEVEKFKETLIELYKPSNIIDYTNYIKKNMFLEGTGAIVLDRINRKAYSSISQRSNKTLFEKFARDLGYQPIIFTSKQLGAEIYHTNVMMSVTTDFVIIALELVDEEYRENLKNEILKTHDILELNGEQILKFAGNCLELEGNNGKILVISKSAYDCLNKDQISFLEKKLKLITIDIDTIQEIGGGSVRCMIAELF